MNHEICVSCETVKHCSQHGCIPKQPLKPCRSPYCECTPGTCSHPGCYDARSEPFDHPAPVEEPVAIEELTDIFHKAWQKDFKESVLGGMSTGSEELKGQWREHVRTGIIALLAAQSPPTVQEPVAYLWQHSQTGRTRIVMPGGIITADAAWFVVGPLVLGNTTAPAAQPAPVQEPYTVVRNAWTGKATYTCNTCGETDFRSEHAARFHICEPPPPAQQPKSHVTHEKIREIFDSYGQYLSGKDLAMLRVIELMLKENK